MSILYLKLSKQYKFGGRFMRVNANFLWSNQTVLPSGAINRSINNQLGNKSKASNDKSVISPQGKAMQMIEQLQKQKETIIQRKNEFLTNAEESGLDGDTVKAMKDLYDKQLEQIDEQISQIYSSQMKEASEEKEKSGVYSKKDVLNEQSDIEKLNSISQAANKISQAEMVHGMAEKSENKISIKESEIHTSELRIDNLESAKLIDNSLSVEDAIKNEQAKIAEKRNEINELDRQFMSLNNIHGGLINDANDEMEDTEESKENSVNRNLSVAEIISSDENALEDNQIIIGLK